MKQDTSSVTFHFAHANGFPAQSYRTLFELLPEDWARLHVEKFGHSTRFPVNKNWANQVSEMIELIKRESKDEPVYGIGHSFGGIVTFMAACEAPALFRGVILIDPPLVTGPWRHLLKVVKRTPVIDKITPAGLSKSRNTRWSQDTDLVDYFASRGLFKNMERRCVKDYVDAAIKRHGNQQVLDFERSIETDIFRNVPHHLSRFTGKLKCPGMLLTGQQTDVCVPVMRNRFIRDNHLEHAQLPGGHMLPFEHPRLVAEFISKTIQNWQTQRESLATG